MNNRGFIIVFWGILEFELVMLEVIFLINFCCFLNYKKFLFICKVVLWILLYFRLWRRFWCGILLNVFVKFNKMIDIVFVW